MIESLPTEGTKEPLLDEQGAANFLGLTCRCLQQWRHAGRGPKYIRISARCIRYAPEMLSDFCVGRTVSSTSQAIPAGV